MRLLAVFRLILFILLGYVVWRLVQTVLRIMGRSSGRTGDTVQEPPAQKQTPSSGFTDVKDAHFEDLPSPKAQDEKKTPST